MLNTLASYLAVLTGRPYHGLQTVPFNGRLWLVVLTVIFVGTCYALIRMFFDEGNRARRTVTDLTLRYSKSDPTTSSD